MLNVENRLRNDRVTAMRLVSFFFGTQCSYYGTLIRNHMHSIEWSYFQWPWVTPNYPKPSHFRHFVSSFIIVELESRDFKFVNWVYRSTSPSWRMPDYPWKGCGQVIWHINIVWMFQSYMYISNGCIESSKFCTHVDYVKCPILFLVFWPLPHTEYRPSILPPLRGSMRLLSSL